MGTQTQHEVHLHDDHVLAWLSEHYTRMGVAGPTRYSTPVCRKFKPVVVDGCRYPSLSRAAEAIGCAKSCLSTALSRGTNYRGKSIRWARVVA